jgi:pilus assembly protein Flp/PilA
VGQTEPNERISDAAGGRPARRLAARSVVAAFLADRRGATAIEYGLICSLIFLVIITAVTSFGNNTSSLINQISVAVSAATSGA